MRPRLASTLFFLLIFLSSAFTRATDKINKVSDCQKYIRGYNEYDELVDGKLKNKFSVFEIEEWSPHTAFEGLLATKDTPQGTKLTLEFRKIIKGKIDQTAQGFIEKPWKNDPQFQKIEIDLKKIFNKEAPAGITTLRLTKKDGTILCEQNLATTTND